MLDPRELYVYWKTQDLNSALPACAGMQTTLRSRVAGLQTELLLRESSSNGLSTLMEIYRHPRGIDDSREASIHAVAESALNGLLASPRVVEAFRPWVSDVD
jgi:Domain of unknown function (DUF4936)